MLILLKSKCAIKSTYHLIESLKVFFIFRWTFKNRITLYLQNKTIQVIHQAIHSHFLTFLSNRRKKNNLWFYVLEYYEPHGNKNLLILCFLITYDGTPCNPSSQQEKAGGFSRVQVYLVACSKLQVNHNCRARPCLWFYYFAFLCNIY